MVKWLQLRRQALVAGIQDIVPEVLDHLVQQGHIDPLQSLTYQEIVSDATVPVRKARTLLDWLSQRTSVVFWAFQQAIIKSDLPSGAKQELLVTERAAKGVMEVVDGMPSSELASLACGGAVLKAREELQSFYRSRSKLRLTSGFSKGKTVSMDKLKVSVCLLSEENAKRAFKSDHGANRMSGVGENQRRSHYLYTHLLEDDTSLLCLDSIVESRDEDEDDDKTLALGGAGCGKTVCFTRKAPHEWALGRLWRTIVLLFCLDLRDPAVWKAKTVIDLLKLVELGLDSNEQEEVRQFIKEHPSQVLLVCDSLDESNAETDSLLWRVITGKCAGAPANLRVIVTTRPCAKANLLSAKRDHGYRRVEVAGFTKEDVEIFALQYLGREEGLAILARLDVHPHVAALMHAPLYCLMICDLFKEKHELPDRKADVFEKIVVGLLRRYASSHGLNEAFSNIANTPANLKRLLRGLGKLAFKGICEKLFFFSSADLENASVPATALELGLLTKAESDDFWRSDKYSFSHLTVQEFLSALYASQNLVRRERDVVELVRKLGFPGHLSTFWEFLAGFLQIGVECLLTALFQEVAPTCTGRTVPRTPPFDVSSNDVNLTLLLFRCFHASHLGRRGTPSPSLGDLLVQYGLQLQFCWLAFSDCTLVHAVLKSHSQSLAELRDVELTCCLAGDAGMGQLLLGLRPCTSIKSLDLLANKITAQSMRELRALVARNSTSLRYLLLDHNALGDEGWSAVAPTLGGCKLLSDLNLERTGLTLVSGRSLCDVLSLLPCLNVLKLCHNNLGDSGFLQISKGLQHVCNLSVLGVQNIGAFSKISASHLRAMDSSVEFDIHGLFQE